MHTDNSTSQQPIGLGGTTWTMTDQNNNQATLQFNNDSTGVYTMDGGSAKSIYWWQYNASFWTQEKKTEKGWFTLIEGTIDGAESGTGQIVVAEQINGEVYVTPFTMTLTS